MSPPLLPLFPLSLVLLPDMSLPLHIFEDRYKEMMADIIPAGAEFGIVLAKNDGIVNVGCTAVVKNVFRRYEDGRLDLMVAGRRRFVISNLDQDKPYLRAEIEFFADDHTAQDPNPDLRQRALKAFAPLLLTGDVDVSGITAATPELSFRLAERLDDLDKKQAVLVMRSETERLEFLLRIIPDYLIAQQRTELARRVAPMNGHAKHITTG